MSAYPMPCTNCGSDRTFSDGGGHKQHCSIGQQMLRATAAKHSGSGAPAWKSEFADMSDADWAGMCNPNEGCK